MSAINHTKKIVLIACASRKGAKREKAKYLYKSHLFKSSLEYAYQQKPDKIFILSALHGLLDINTKIAPYNVTLCYVPKNKRKPGLKILTQQEKLAWRDKVLTKLGEHCDLDRDIFIVLAGLEYIKPIKGCIKNLENPLNGKRQGERIKYLNNYLI